MDVSVTDANNSGEELSNISSLLASSPSSPGFDDQIDSDKEMSEEITEGFRRLKELVTELLSEENSKNKWELEENGQFVQVLLKQLADSTSNLGFDDSVALSSGVNEVENSDILEQSDLECDEDLNKTSEEEIEIEDQMLLVMSTYKVNAIVGFHSTDTSSDAQDPACSSIASSSAPSSPRGVPAAPVTSITAPGKSRYEMIRDDIIAERNEQLKAMGFFAEFRAIRAEMIPEKPNKVKYKTSKVKKKRGSSWVRRSERLFLSSPEIEKSRVLKSKKKEADVSRIIEGVLNTVCQKNNLATLEFQLTICKKCGKEFKKEKYLAAHIKYVKCGQQLYKCDQCDFITRFQSLIPRHKYSVHKVPSTKKYYSCEKCDYVHELRSRVNTHRLRVHKIEELIRSRDARDAFVCDQCNKFETRHLKELKRHKIKVHSDVSMCYRCDKCSFNTSYINNLRRHASLLHPGASDVDSDLESIEIFTDDSEDREGVLRLEAN